MKRLTILFVFLLTPVLAQESKTVKLTLSPETTYLTEPQLPDGRIDYLAAINKKLAAQTTPENNLIVGINSLLPGEQEMGYVRRKLYLPGAEYNAKDFEPQRKYREKFWKMIGLDAPPPMDALVEITPGFYDHTVVDYKKELLEFYTMEELATMFDKPRERDIKNKKYQLGTGYITQEQYDAHIKKIETEIPGSYYGELIHDQWYETTRQLWTAKDYPYLAKWLPTTDELAKKLMDISRQRTGYYHPYIDDDSGLMYIVLLPYAQSQRTVARYFQSRGNFEFARGNFDEAMECSFVPLRMGRTMRSGAGFIVDDLVGIAMTGMGNYQLTTYLANLPKEKDAAWILQKKKEFDAIESESQPLPWLPMWCEVERFGMLGIIQAFAIEPQVVHNFSEEGYVFDKEAMEKYDKLFRSGIEYDWNEVMRLVNPFYDDWEDVLLIPNWQRRLRAMSRLEQRAVENAKRSIDSDDVPERKAAEFLVGNIFSSLAPAINALARIEWDTQITSVAFALAAYRADNGGTAPGSLEELVPKYLDKIPDSPYTDKPLRYIKRQNDVLIANDDAYKYDGSEEEVEKRIAAEKPGGRAFPSARSFVFVVARW